MTSEKKKSKATVISVVAFASLIAIFCVAYCTLREKTVEGAKTVVFAVVAEDKTETDFTIHTDEEYLGKALAAEGIITYNEGGYYTEINGITADWDKDNSWWCLMQNGEMLSTGINDTVIKDGDRFDAVYTIG